MELSEEIVKGLAVASDQKGIPDSAFAALVELALSILLKEKTEEAITAHSALANLDPFALKQAYSAIAGFLLEAARRNADSMVVRGKLEEARLPEPRRAALDQAFSQKREALRRLLFTTGFNFPHVVGVEWRLDYFIKTDRLDKVNVPMCIALKSNNTSLHVLYFDMEDMVTLKTDEGQGRMKDITFACSVEELQSTKLQDLVTKLRSAVKQVDRIIQT